MPSRLVKVLAGVAAGVSLFALTFRCAGPSPYDQRREALARDCAAFRAHHDGSVCDPDGPTRSPVPAFKDADASITAARAAFARGDSEAGARALRHAVDVAESVEGRGSFLGALMSAALVDRILDAVDVSTMTDREVAGLLANRRLASFWTALEGERLYRLSVFVNLPRALRVPTGPIGKAVAADVMRVTDGRFHAMASAIAAGDLDACRRAARVRDALVSPSGLDESLCKKLSQVKATSARLDKVRGRALARAR